MKNVFTSSVHENLLFALILVSIPALRAMERLDVPTKESAEKLLAKLDTIKPVSKKPILKIPSYVFENCNQVTRHAWSADHLAKLRKAAGNVTREILQEKCSKNGVFNLQSYTAMVETYEWINALNYIETHLQAKDSSVPTVHEIKKINYYATRLTSEIPGEFRQGDKQWPLGTPTLEEFIFFQTMDGTIFRKKLFNGEHYITYNPKTTDIPIEGIKALLEHYKNDNLCETAARHHTDAATAALLVSRPINPDIVYSWLAEQEGSKECTINFDEWRKRRIHIFPSFKIAPVLLSKFLHDLQMSSHSPVIKAILIWLEIVRIHPFEDAHKRTGKLAASRILLQNGYLPPLITREDAEEYKELLKKALRTSDEPVAFVQFIVRLIDRTQRNPEILKQLGLPTP